MQLVREENPVNAAFRVWPELTPTLLFDGGCDAVHTGSIYGAVSSSVNRSCSALFLVRRFPISALVLPLPFPSLFFTWLRTFSVSALFFSSFFETLSVNVVCFLLCLCVCYL